MGCSFDSFANTWLDKSYILTLMVLCWLAPTTMNLVCYVAILSRVRASDFEIYRVTRRLNSCHSRFHYRNKVKHIHTYFLYSREILVCKMALINCIIFIFILMMVQLKMEITLGKMACKLLILWMIAWTPYAVMNLWMMFFSPNGITAVFGLIPTICTKCSAAGNAALYGIRYVLVISNSLLGAMKYYVNSLGSSYASRNVVLDCQNSKQK